MMSSDPRHLGVDVYVMMNEDEMKLSVMDGWRRRQRGEHESSRHWKGT